MPGGVRSGTPLQPQAPAGEPAADGAPHYGINTGFGSLARERIAAVELPHADRQRLARQHRRREPALDVGEAGGVAGVATYNGKSFDLPLLETRYVLHRLASPFGGLPHVDLLHPARRLWRDPEAEDCRLTTLEQTLCGYAREGDVPGFEIPSRFAARWRP